MAADTHSNKGQAMTTIDEFQNRVAKWCAECFGRTTAENPAERNWRFLEEALELVQSLGGNAEDAHKLVDYVFARESGDPAQEIGGTLVTLAALASASKLQLNNHAMAELQRIEQPDVVNSIRVKHAEKIHRSPLADDYRYGKAP